VKKKKMSLVDSFMSLPQGAGLSPIDIGGHRNNYLRKGE
jgi:hypothetical protein